MDNSIGACKCGLVCGKEHKEHALLARKYSTFPHQNLPAPSLSIFWYLFITRETGGGCVQKGKCLFILLFLLLLLLLRLLLLLLLLLLLRLLWLLLLQLLQLQHLQLLQQQQQQTTFTTEAAVLLVNHV